MRIVLEQSFPLGRFHATPWKIFPYDDPHGEWPPSPWRLARAVLARSFQLDREIVGSAARNAGLRNEMVRAFAASQVSWQLPPLTWRGPGLRQYHPAEFKRVPASAKERGMMAYNTTKVLDNFWVTASDLTAPVIWVFDGADWNDALLAHLDACLARMIYFGRAESITEIRRARDPHVEAQSLTKAQPRRTGNAVPVLGLRPDATLSQLGATTDSPEVASTEIPPGSRWMFAERPARPIIRPMPRRKPSRPETSWMQFALGSRIPIHARSAVVLTQRFRGRALGCFVHHATAGETNKLKEAPREVRERAALFAGKDADGNPLNEHEHPFYFLHFDGDAATRLCMWRATPFNVEEQTAILKAAELAIALTHKKSAWTANLIPLDRLVPPPPAIGERLARTWKTITPYVPARHVHNRRGKEKPGESVVEQVQSELKSRGFPTATVALADMEAQWVKVHRPSRKQGEATNDDKRGYQVRITFADPQKGPLFLGHSCHFGLGLFVPADG
jgi:CRISPR-associated protein Csb2